MRGMFPEPGHPVGRAFLLMLVLGAVMLSVGCEPTRPVLMSTPEPLPLRMAIPDRDFRLSDADRAEMLPGFDVEALERLLGMMNPELRQDFLRHFQKREGSERLGLLVEVFDPEMQKVLEEVWAPQWDRATDAEIEANIYGLPGREVAKQRRAGRGRVKQESSDRPSL